MYDCIQLSEKSERILKTFQKVLPEYDSILTGNVIFHQRTMGIGPLSLEDAIGYGVTGPQAGLRVLM